MLWLKRFQLSMIHVAVTLTAVPMENVLNRVMIHEYHFSALLVAFFLSIPYISSPVQAWIGALSDRGPFFRLHRTPYIAAGIFLCAVGVVLAPWAVLYMKEHFAGGVFLSVLAFGCWGMGFNLATVSYFSLASEVSGPNEKARTIAMMFILMIASVIAASILLSRRLDPFSTGTLVSSFYLMGGIALVLGWTALLGLEKKEKSAAGKRPSPKTPRVSPFRELFQNKSLLLFFFYLFFLLVPLLGQDLLIEPFGAQVFGMSVKETTRLSSIWGTGVLLSMVLGAIIERNSNRRVLILFGSWIVLLSLTGLLLSGLAANKHLFYSLLLLMGIGTGLSTVSNLSLMLDMTSPGKVGAYMGLWGMADTLARGLGNLFNGALLDL
ncbi:MAG: BCD family MFS transporter, partial [Spirochaetia bacterium]|nr:BCD family MFS transporter [Spirochaetia bacterium]